MDVNDEQLNETKTKLSKIDKRKITSKANAEKARIARQQKTEHQRELKKKYDSDSETDSDSESDEEIVLYPKKKGEKIKDKKIKQHNDNDELKREIEDLKIMMQVLATKTKKKPVKKVYIEKQAPIQPSTQVVQPGNQSEQLNEHIKRRILNF